MSKFPALCAVSVFVCASCVLGGNVLREPLVPAPEGPPRERAEPSFEEVYDSGYWVTRPRDGTITVLGIAGRRGNREAAITEALADGARKAALYHGVYGVSAVVLNQGSGGLDYFSDFDYRLDLLTPSGDYIGELRFDKDRDILEKDGSVLVRLRYSGVSGVPAYETVMEDGRPGWVRDYAALIPGFLTAVGYAKNRGSLQKTCRASYENAIVSLLPRLSSRLAAEVIDGEGGRITRNIAINSGVLEKVMILETWVDKKTNALWTLVAAQEKPR